MFKTILLIKKRDDISRSQFIDYYENNHLPFMLDLIPGKLSFHRRNYLLDSSNFEYRGGDSSPGWPGDFDVITEAIYESQKEAEDLTAMCRHRDIYKRIIADEANFIEPGRVKKYVVETRETRVKPIR